MQTIEQLLSGELKGAKKIKLSCDLKTFPLEILELNETLEYLDLSGNRLSELPEDFKRLKKLKIAFFSDNDFTEFPKVLSECPILEMIGFKANKINHVAENAIPVNTRWLILTNNQITSFPKSIGKCFRLQKCMLAGNKISQLPEEMAACESLELLRISANNFSTLPEWLFDLPRLSWLAFSGNSIRVDAPNCKELKEIPWQDLTIKAQLGEGASGIISKAIWKKNNGDISEVAVKVFKGEVTSDGLPSDEMNACIWSASHPHLVKVLGKISQHPDEKQGLVLELIPPSFKNLGGPPSFETCTRDTFQEGTAFSIKEILSIASGISSAAKHLHKRGIMHGDLYAHNILIDENAYPLFGDFGAATTYDKSNFKKAETVEGIEVRAFGCLLDDLLQNINPLEINADAAKAIAHLRDKCMKEEISDRPDFTTICENLSSYND